MNALAYLLGASIAANALLGWAWIDARDARTVAEQQRDQTRADATAVSDAVEALDNLAKKRAAATKPVQAAARAAAVAVQQRATQRLLPRRPSPTTTAPALQACVQRWEGEGEAMKTVIAIAAAAALAGCGTVRTVQVKVPVQVECRVQTPARPAMPLEALGLAYDVDTWVAQVIAKVALREA